MSPNLRWRIVLVIVVALFALALVWPTIRWATLGNEATETLSLRYAEVPGLTPKEMLALRYYQWDAELQDDLEYTRDIVNLNDEKVRDKRRKRLFDERAELQQTLEADTKERIAADDFEHLPAFEQAKQLLKLELDARTPRRASLARNIRHDVDRWWRGDEDKILHLGLDLKGGIYMVIETDADARNEVYEKLKNRIDEFGVAEPILQTQGSKRIIIQLPGATDLEKAERLIKEKAVMFWMLVEERKLRDPIYSSDNLLNIYDRAVEDLPDMGPDPKKPDAPDAIVPYKDDKGNVINFDALDKKLADDIPVDTILRIYEDVDEFGNKTRKPLLLRRSENDRYIISGDDLRPRSCKVTKSPYGEPEVAFALRSSEAKKRFAEITGDYSPTSKNKLEGEHGAIGWRLAILLDNKVVSAPWIRTRIAGGRGVITLGGRGTFDTASRIALQLRSGSLPAEIEIVQNIQVGPRLGADSIRMGWQAAIIGLAVVVIFMAVYYRVAGTFAVVALVINMVLILGALAAAGATLTLPGIAGIILTIGMAVDANVLIFERIREELGAAKKIKAAVDAGYHKALRTILDANITTLITAMVLFFLGTGPVRGFAVTLSIGICTSVFSALVITRVLFDLLLLNKSVVTLKMFRFFQQPNIDFVKARRTAMLASAAVILIGLVAFGADLKGNFGIDFKGGTVYRLDFAEEVDVADVRDALNDRGITEATVQGFDIAGGRVTKIMIQVPATPETDERLKDLPAHVAGTIGTELNDQSVESISGSVSKDLGRQTLVAFLLALCGILVYVSWRFEFKFAVGAIIALLHDVLITVGFFAGFFIFTRREINAPTIAAFLTIVGYSLNDTIVVFDRIREDLKIMKRLDLRTIINTSINQTLSRTVLTSLTTLLVILSLFALGGQAINDFSFAMLIGVIVGTYSSIYIASPVLLLMHRKKIG